MLTLKFIYNILWNVSKTVRRSKRHPLKIDNSIKQDSSTKIAKTTQKNRNAMLTLSLVRQFRCPNSINFAQSNHDSSNHKEIKQINVI